MDIELDGGDELERRACEWMARRLRGAHPPWSGPAVVVIRTRRLVVAFEPDDPVEVEAPVGMRFRLRVAPLEFPAIGLVQELDRGPEPVRAVVCVPPAGEAT